MKLNRIELKKIIYDFNSISNRLMQASFEDYTGVLFKFTEFIHNNEIIFEYIENCGECEQNIEQEFEEVKGSYGNAIFSLGVSDDEEIRNVFAILNYIVNNKIEIHYGIANAYSHSRKYQDRIKGFNERVVMILIRHIERYLTKIGIEMGLDDKIVYSINVKDGQVNIANDNATINATQNIGINTDELKKLLDAVRAEIPDNIPEEDKETVNDSLDVISSELLSDSPNEKNVKSQFKLLKKIDCGVKFASSCFSLLTFADKMYPFLKDVVPFYQNLIK